MSGARPPVRLMEAADLGAGVGVHLRALLEEARHAGGGRASLAIPGGRSPVPALRWLAENLDGDGITLTFVDERHLPLPAEAPVPDADSWRGLPAESNLRLAWEHWLSRTARPPEVLPLAREGSLDAAVGASAAALASVLPLDVALVGFGEDGHMASLFPQHPALDADAVVVGVTDSPKPPPVRLSLSLPVLNRAGVVVLLVPNPAKARVLASAWTGGPDPALPISLLRPGRLDVLAAPEAYSILREVLDAR